MIPSHTTAAWPTYRVEGEFDGSLFAVEPPDDFEDQAKALFDVTPNVAFRTFSKDTDSCSVSFGSDLPEELAIQLGQELLERASPGAWSNFVGSMSDWNQGFVVPTIVDTAKAAEIAVKTVAETSVGVVKSLSWVVPLALLGAAIVAAYVFARKSSA